MSTVPSKRPQSTGGDAEPSGTSPGGSAQISVIDVDVDEFDSDGAQPVPKRKRVNFPHLLEIGMY